MKRLFMTQEILDEHHNRKKDQYRREVSVPPYLHCNLCMRIDLVKEIAGANIERIYAIRDYDAFFKIKDEVVLVEYPNGAKGYYHVKCFEDPKNAEKVEDILRMDVDRWNGVNEFIEDLVKKKLTDNDIILRVKSKFKCGYTTAWRKLNSYRKG